jgi:hypothetical protein
MSSSAPPTAASSAATGTAAAPTSGPPPSAVGRRVVGRVQRRTWPVVFSLLFFCLGMLYFFCWGPVVQHIPSLWESPSDLWGNYSAANAFIHGNFVSVYSRSWGFLALPGLLVLLAPIAALGTSLHTTLIEIGSRPHFLAHPHTLNVVVPRQVNVVQVGKNLDVLHPQVFLFLGPYELLLSCVVLFALDALAERLGVSWKRRAVLGLTEAVVLWNVSVIWGHPEDAFATALALYALLFAIDGRWTGAGWIFGCAFAVQPLVLVIFPILLATGGKERAKGLVLRGAIPGVIVTIVPLVAAFHTTVRSLIEQPTYPLLNHATPWTTFAPKIGGLNGAVGGGPVRSVALILACLLGWWARRWRSKPEMLVWAAALALALRVYTESVMTPYYVWPALAVGLLVAARRSQWRFGVAIVAAVVTTVVAQSHLGEFPWWAIDVAGVSVVLVAAVDTGGWSLGSRGPGFGPVAARRAALRRNALQRNASQKTASLKTATQKKKKKKAAQSARKRR